ncbi:MAG: site-specific integrase [Chloroflexi bacterium]|nr:site-specific integrase [Chloroflexota bacterium]
MVTFADYLSAVGVNVTAAALATEPATWAGLTWGLVKGFAAWMLKEGYAVGSINRKLSSVKVYAKLAAQAGALTAEDAALIRSVSGYGGKEGKRIDERRDVTRVGGKKENHVTLTVEQVKELKTQPDTAQGRRDALLPALLFDLGLRVGEVALLEVGDFNLKENVLRFYRPKVHKTQTHKMTQDLRRAFAAWVESGDCPPFGPVLRGSRKGGALTDAGMSERAITERVKVLGEAVGVAGLSAHDCRHYWASRAASQGTDAFALRDAGGWSSLAMPSRYVESATIANERVRL